MCPSVLKASSRYQYFFTSDRQYICICVFVGFVCSVEGRVTAPDQPSQNIPKIHFKDVVSAVLTNHDTDTAFQKDRVQVIQTLLNQPGEGLKKFCEAILSRCAAVYDETLQGAQRGAKELTEFQKLWNSFLTTGVTTIVKNLYSHNPSVVEHSAAMVLISALKEKHLEDRLPKDPLPPSGTSHPHVAVDPHSQGASKIRYLGGRCIAKGRYSLMQAVKRNLYTNRDAYKNHRECLTVLEHLMITEQEVLDCSDYLRSLHETERRQNIRRSLVNITDDGFLFFCALESRRQELTTLAAFQRHGGNVLLECDSAILGDTTLLTQWHGLFPHDTYDERALMTCFQDITARYLRIGSNQYRKGLVASMRKKKRHAHRVEVQKSTGSLKNQQQTVESDAHAIPGPSRKSARAAQRTAPAAEPMPTTSTQLVSRGRDKGHPAQGVKRKSSCPKGKGKGKGKGSKGKRKSISEICPICEDAYKEGETDWIECTTCTRWLHFDCTGLTNADMQTLLADENAPFICPRCTPEEHEELDMLD